MTTCKFSIAHGLGAIQTGDFLCLPYLSRHSPAFSPELLPEELSSVVVPEEPGESRTVFIGRIGDRHVAAEVCRLDKKDTQEIEQMRLAVPAALEKARALGLKRVLVLLDNSQTALCRAVQEGALLGGYVFDKYRSTCPAPLPVKLVLRSTPAKEIKSFLARGKEMDACVNFARDVLNEPPGVIHPVSLADAFLTFGTARGMKVTVWDEKRLLKEKCNGILSVGKGSAIPPRFVIGEYLPKKPVIHLALVGKGVTFDSGGYSLKPTKSMEDMKFDMGGAAMMWAGAAAIAALRLPVRITAYTPLVHNAISGDAYNVSDVIRMRDGTTVEVTNTDAEGRIILADALSVAQDATPDIVIDAATLTGAAVVALGEDIAALYGTNPDITRKFIDAAASEGERLWEMPLYSPYISQLDSTIADIRNSGDRWGGSITAALFLKKFIREGVTWIHADIAGPGCKQTPLFHLGKGAKGFGVKSVVAFAENLSA